MSVSEAFTSAGTTISVSSSQPATYDQDGFEALSYTEIGEVVDMGEFGRTYNVVTHNPIGDRRTVKRKGSFNDGTLALQMARVTSDAGQTLLIDGLASDDSYSFKVVLQDLTAMYFTAQIVSYPITIGGVDSITSTTVNLEIDSDIVEVTGTSS